jgi:hypothetical protein
MSLSRHSGMSYSHAEYVECECCAVDILDVIGVAQDWYSGQADVLYQTASTGYVGVDTLGAFERIETELTSPRALRYDDPKGKLERVQDAIAYLRHHAPEDTSEDDCTEHGLDECPDCHNGGIPAWQEGEVSS